MFATNITSLLTTKFIIAMKYNDNDDKNNYYAYYYHYCYSNSSSSSRNISCNSSLVWLQQLSLLRLQQHQQEGQCLQRFYWQYNLHTSCSTFLFCHNCKPIIFAQEQCVLQVIISQCQLQPCKARKTRSQPPKVDIQLIDHRELTPSQENYCEHGHYSI